MDSTYEMVKELIDFNCEGVDTYNHNGSTWLIFTDNKKWVIELTKEKTLWYNYYFFTGVFKYLSLDVVENQHYITKWVEDTVINGVKSTQATPFETRKGVEDTLQNGVKSIKGEYYKEIQKVEYTIQYGVKETHSGCDLLINEKIEHTIQNGVKSTQATPFETRKGVEDTIINGVKKTYSDKIPHEYDWTGQFIEEIEGIIQNGVKHTEKSLQIDGSCVIEDVIKEGVKHTEYGDWEDGDERLDDIIDNGIKETKKGGFNQDFQMFGTIENGVKETKTPGDGDIVSTIKWMKENNTDSVPDMINDIIDNGVKETTPGGYLGSVEMKGKTVHQFEHAKQDDNVKDVIKNGIKKTEAAALFDEESKMDTVISEGIRETHDDVIPHTGRVDGVIKNGVKQCIPSRHPLYNPMDFSVQYRENHRLDDVASVLEKGIKEVQPLPSQEGNMDYSNYYYRQGVPTKPHTKYVDDVITNGIKETWGYDKQPQIRIDNVIENGIRPTSKM